MYENEIISIASIVVSLSCVAISLRHGLPSSDQYRRFLKFMITGKYEPPKTSCVETQNEVKKE